MIEFSERIPVDPEYAKSLGFAVYNYATLAWMIVYLGSLVDPDFVNQGSTLNFEEIASSFKSLSGTGKYQELPSIAQRFTDLTARRADLERAIPITAYGGAQELDGTRDGKDDQWTIEGVKQFAADLQDLDMEANGLYYKLKPAH